MPTREELIEALGNQERLVKKIDSLNLRMKILVGALVVAVVALVLASTAAFIALKNSRDNVRTLEVVKENAQAAAVLACQVGNTSNLRARQAVEHQADAIEHALGSVVTSPQGQASVKQLVTEMRDAIPRSEDTDRDCTMPLDGLGANDYLVG